MLPTLTEGQEILVRPIESSRHPFEAGTIVLMQHPIQSDVQMIKRITSIDDEDAITVLGDNADESTDSRQFGRVRKRHILGVVVCTFP